MSLFDKKHLVSPADALHGRNTPMPVATLHAVNGHSMTNVPDGMEIAIFAMGCFWGVERLFWQLLVFTALPLVIQEAIHRILLTGKCALEKQAMPKRYVLFTILR